MSYMTIAVIGLVVLFILLFSGMNIGFALLLVGFFGYAAVTNFKAAISIVGTVPYTIASNYNYTVIGLFVLMGYFAYYSGLSSNLFEFAHCWLNRVPGGLACATVVACAGFGAICGSGAATASTMGVVAVPQMQKYGYSDELAGGCAAAGGTIGLLIPPSTGLILFGILTETSIGKLFAAGILPGIVLTVCLCITIIIWAMIRPSIAPRTKEKITWSMRLRSVWGVLPVIGLFVFVMGGIFAGWFTATEAAGIGAFAALIMMIGRRQFTWAKLKTCLVNTLKSMGMIYLVLIGATVFGNFLVISRMPSTVAKLVIAHNLNRYVVLFALCVIYLILGMLMDTLPVLVMVMPVFLPVLIEMNFDIIYIGIITTMLAMIGQITPPVGICTYVVSGTMKISLEKVFKGVAPLIVGNIVAIFLIILFPQISLWLPSILRV